jgi:Cu+-exporting ATPase
VLDRTADVDTILLDKTGTLTTGRMRLLRVTVAVDAADAEPGPDAEARALGVAAALERGSEHPIARAVVLGAEAANAPRLVVAGFRASSGLGVTGRADGLDAAAGRPGFLADLGHRMPDDLAAVATGSDASLVAVGWDGEVRALLEVGDDVRDGARDAVARLRAQGLRPALATGDAPRAAERVARAVGIDEVHSALAPEEKLALVRRLQARGRRVAMAGDGVNDAAALAAADLGIAMGGGTDAAASASDLALLRDDPAGIPDAIDLARATRATIRGNLFWAFAYNVAAIPLAAAGFLNPMIAGAAMAFSSVFVVLNSLRLRSA